MSFPSGVEPAEQIREGFRLSDAVAEYWRLVDERSAPYRGVERREVRPLPESDPR
jgi:hypothetical protein